MIRDYSDELKANLKALADAVEPDGVWESIADWIGDTFSPIFYSYNIEDHLNEINEYYAMTINKDDVTSERIDEIFAAVETVDTTDSEKLAGSTELMSTLNGFLGQYANNITVGHVTFCNPEKLPVMDPDEYADYLWDVGYPERVEAVAQFDAENPDIADDLNTAFEDMAEDCPEDVVNLKYLIYNAPEPYRSLIIDNIDTVVITETNGWMDVSQYDDGVIYIDWNDPGCMAEDAGGPYSTFFHELGHYLDDVFGEDGNYLTDTFTTSSGATISEMIDGDVEAVVRQRVDEMCPDLSEAEKEEVVDRLIHGNLPGYVDDDSQKVIDAAKTVQEDIYKDLSEDNAHGASDAYDGSTNFLRNEGGYPESSASSNTGKGVAGEFGHDNDYYYNTVPTADGTGVTTTAPQPERSGAREGFAYYFADQITGYDDNSGYYDDYLPNTTGGYAEVVDNMAAQNEANKED